MEKGLIIITNEYYSEIDMFDIERNKGKFVNSHNIKPNHSIVTHSYSLSTTLKN